MFNFPLTTTAKIGMDGFGTLRHHRITAGTCITQAHQILKTQYNTTRGFWGGGAFYGCIATGNGSYGIIPTKYAVVINCVSHDNGSDGIYGDESTTVIGCRVTANDAYGMRQSLSYTVNNYLHNYIPDTGENQANTNGALFGAYYKIFNDETNTDTNDTTGTDTDAGYTDVTSGAEDFNLTSGASIKQVEIQIPGV